MSGGSTWRTTLDDPERRIVNSVMLTTGGPEGVGEKTQPAFVATEEISQKLYG